MFSKKIIKQKSVLQDKCKLDKSIPSIGLGTWKLNDDELQRIIESGLEIGYRIIDTAVAYRNHKAIGNAIKTSGINRAEVHITTKVEPNHTSLIESYLNTALEELQVEYIDSMLIHYPRKNSCMKDIYRFMNSVKARGLIRSWGVSNFTKNHLIDCINSEYIPDINQIEYHPHLNQIDLREFCLDFGIVVSAYRPFGKGALFEDSIIREISFKYDRLPSQIILNWIINKNISCYPKTSNPIHLKQNFESTNFIMEDDDLIKLDKIRYSRRYCSGDWDDFGY